MCRCYFSAFSRHLHMSLWHLKVLRSGASWSVGMKYTEDSIQQAYVDMITNAQHYVYIENQFFVSMINSGDVHNKISIALLDRIARAYE